MDAALNFATPMHNNGRSALYSYNRNQQNLQLNMWKNSYLPIYDHFARSRCVDFISLIDDGTAIRNQGDTSGRSKA